MDVTMVSCTEKIDVLDLLINILQDHEAKLDELVSRLEAAEGDISYSLGLSSRVGTPQS